MSKRVFRNRSSRSLFLLLAFCLAITGQATGSKLAAGQGTGEEPRPREQPDDPFLPVTREQLPRSLSAPVVRGSHLSIQVNVDALGSNILGDAANEPSMAIDPTNPSDLVIGWRQFDTVVSNFRQAGYAYSHDGGATWTFPGVLDPGQFRSDPVLSANRNGIFYYYSLSSATSAEMFFSTDKGVTWSLPIPAFGGDKPWMNIDTTGGIGNNHIYITWNTQFTCCTAGTDFTRSVDGGSTYEGPDILPSHPKWGTVDVGPDGELYIVGTRLSTGAFPQTHLILRSDTAKDALQTPIFDRVTGIDLGGETAFSGGPNPGGLLGQVGVAVDRSTTPTRGNVYVLGSVDPPGPDPLDVMFVGSTDGGQSFTPLVRVNHDTAQDAAYQWFGTISVAPNGRIDVIWNDTINDPTDVLSEVFYAYSIDAGTTWSAGLPVTPPWNSLIGWPNQNKIGDYYHMISDLHGASLAYAATFNGEQDVYFLRVGDCNANGQHDSLDIFPGSSFDCNFNRIPDECEENLICKPCTSDADCDDGIFCTGAETCDLGLGHCMGVLPEACDDGDQCTADSCDINSDTCVNTPIPLPGDVGDTLELFHDPALGTALIWFPTPTAAHYNSYRGSVPSDTMGARLSGPYDHACLESADAFGDGLNVTVEVSSPAPGETFYYLANGETGCAEGTLGNDSSGAPRPILTACPTPP